MPALHDPGGHRPLAGLSWSETAAREGIATIADDARAAYRGHERLWPNHPADLEEREPDRPYRNVYLGAAGVAWALARLAAEGWCEPLADAGGLADPELTDLYPAPAPSLLFGESGVRLAALALAGTAEETAQAELEACVRANARNPVLELCWGSPGTMLAALALWRTTGQPRWRLAWQESAEWLLDQWEDTVWTQDLYGRRRAHIGAGHGFAGNAYALLEGTKLLGDGAGTVADRAARALAELALVADGEPLAQWPTAADAPAPRLPVQWCHGAPGIVISLAGLPADPETDRLLDAGGELTWRAGPLRKGAGLCHGTAGNAFALLALHRRTGEARWLERARAFAMDALADVARRRAQLGRGRYSLFTGDVGVALLLRACLTGDARFPFLADAL